MNLPLFIAQRIHFSKGEDNRKVTPPVIRIAMAGVALGLAVMILAVAIVVGFKKEIREKVVGFSSHIQITNFKNSSLYDSYPVALSDSIRQLLQNDTRIARLEGFASKPGIIKTENEFLGIVLNGAGADYDWSFLKSNLIEGELPDYSDSTVSNQVLLSRYMADKLHLKVGDGLYTYFIQDDNVRARKFTISGIYQTNFLDYDRMYVMADVRHIQRLNGWNSDQYTGFSVLLHDYGEVDAMTEKLYFEFNELSDPYDQHYYVSSLKEQNIQIFSWLDMLDMNVWIILGLMAIVSGFTMISGLFIIILERINMIGVLKALGAPNFFIRKTFLYVSLFLVGKGMLFGNLVGLSFCLIQSQFHIIKLNPQDYYISAVPIDLSLWAWILLNIGCLAVSLLMLLGASYIVSMIRPARSIRFE